MSNLKQLGQSVFERDDCPYWAKSAAIDDDSRLWVYSCKKSRLIIGYGSWIPEGVYKLKMFILDDGYDTTNWQKSAINRKH